MVSFPHWASLLICVLLRYLPWLMQKIFVCQKNIEGIVDWVCTAFYEQSLSLNIINPQFKVIVCSKILSSFTHPPVWISFLIFWRMSVTKQLWGSIDLEVNGNQKLFSNPYSSKYLPVCSTEEIHLYRFWTTLGWVNDYRILIFGWVIPLRLMLHSASM